MCLEITAEVSIPIHEEEFWQLGS